jgi:aminomethyltransferase
LIATAARTPLYEEHLRMGAQMISFSGWQMPLQYSSIREEHRAVREAVGLFDLSHMGELQIEDGPLAQRVVSRDLSKLKAGRAQYALMCNQQGGILDDVLVYAMTDGSYFVVVNAGHQDADYNWVTEQAQPGETVFNAGPDWALIGVQGPRAVSLVQRLAAADAAGIGYYRFAEGRVADVPCIISRTGYTGEDGFELFCGRSDAVGLWRSLLENGQSEGIRPAGLGARDTLRLEAGMRLYGNDMDVQTNPVEAGLEWAVNLDAEFIGREAIAALKEAAAQRILVGLKMLDRSIPRHGYRVLLDGQPIGIVTSGNISFTLGYNIAMAYVPPQQSRAGTQLTVEVRGTAAPAEVVPLPFYKRPHPK